MKSVIPLGECPFCGGGVTVGVDEYDSETGMVYFSYGDRPRCENGCPVGRFDNQRRHFYGIWVTAEKDAAPVFRERWKREVEALRNRPVCPDCGKRAEFKSDGKDFLILGCPHCQEGPDHRRARGRMEQAGRQETRGEQEEERERGAG